MKDPRLPRAAGILLSALALTLSCLALAPAQALEEQPNAQGVATSAQQPQEATVAPETDRFVVTFKKSDKAEKEAALDEVESQKAELEDLEIVKDSVATDTDTVVISNKEQLDKTKQQEIVEALEADPRVESVEPDPIVHALAASPTSEPLFSAQWALQSSYLNAAKVWNRGITGSGQTVAVVDTGYSTHPDLKNPVAQYDFVSDTAYSLDGDGRDSRALDPGVQNSMVNWHGTFVTGQIAAKVNSYGITGLAYGADIVQARALGYGGGGYVSDIADAIVWSAGGQVAGVPANPRPATVINASLAYPSNQCSATMSRAINYALSREIPVVVAAGNAAQNAAGYEPANCWRAIVVGATGYYNTLASYSNYGSTLDVLAPGGDGSQQIYSTENTGFYSVESPSFGTKIGTSMATPHVTATIALMKQANPKLTVEQIRQTLVNTGTSVGGYRMINPEAAVAAVTPARGYVVKNGIKATYDRGGGAAIFGEPTSNEFKIRDGAYAQRFSKGYTIYWHPRYGSAPVKSTGAIGSYYRDLGYENGLGFPIEGETYLGVNGGYRQVFNLGSKQNRVYWSNFTGTHILNGYGAIYSKWLSKGHLRTDGYPVTDEIRTGSGYVQYFRNASGKEAGYWWSTATGAHTLNSRGAIYYHWRNNGYLNTFGFPVTDETRHADGSYSVKFSNGSIISWTAARGIRVIR